jgi:hypothetical protein
MPLLFPSNSRFARWHLAVNIVESHISRKTSEIWATRHLWPMGPFSAACEAQFLLIDGTTQVVP